MAIPVQNLYYLLCYAWDSLEERDKLDVGEESSPDILDLLARVLVSGLSYCVKRGFDRNYVQKTEVMAGLRGRVDFSATIKRNGFSRGELTCVLDDFTPDVLHNRIIKATLVRLLGCDIPQPLKVKLHANRLLLAEVSDIRVTSSDFRRVILHRNNSFYRFLLNVCALIHRNTLPKPDGTGFSFSEFTGSNSEMGLLFEAFIRNFINIETKLQATKERIRWNWHAADTESYQLLPTMETDVSVRGGSRKLVIECKFAVISAPNAYDAQKLRREHLFQLHAYLSNLPDTAENADCRGILLYPSIDVNLCYKYASSRKAVEVRTLNLNQDWQQIRADILALVRSESPSLLPC